MFLRVRTVRVLAVSSFFFFNDTATTEIYTLSLHDALPISFLKSMLDAGTGTIVNIASLAGKNGIEGGTAYCASKHAVLGFSKSLMLEVRKHGLRVVAICPGSVATPFMDKRERPRPARDRALTADDVAHAVLSTLTVPDRAMISEVDIRPTNP